jgi:hypothetical protein
MSDLKYQLRALLPSPSVEARKLSDPAIKQRIYPLKRIAESPKSVAHACRLEGKSTAWFYNWASRLLKLKLLVALKPRSRRRETLAKADCQAHCKTHTQSSKRRTIQWS